MSLKTAQRINYYMSIVRVYHAGIPANNKIPEKKLVLTNFHLGVEAGKSTEVFQPVWEESRLGVIQGWVHENSGSTPHLNFRRTVIEKQRETGNHVLTADSNLFLFADPGNSKTYLRFSLDGIFPTTGNYFTNTVDPARWNKIKNDLGIDLKPVRKDGYHILICLQRNGGWSMGDLNVMEWCNSVIDKIRMYSNRNIVVRAHPGDKSAKNYLKLEKKNVIISKNPSIIDDLKGAWATVTYNSSPGVVSAIQGIPVFVTDPNPTRSQAFPIANLDLEFIEKPTLPDRKTWIESIAMSHYNFEDLRSGTAWNIIKEYI
jgi:hypothetical protein